MKCGTNAWQLPKKFYVLHPMHPMVTCIALSTRARVIQLLQLDLNGDICCIFSVKMDSTVPSAIGFTDYTNEIYIFGLFNGCLYVHSDVQLPWH